MTSWIIIDKEKSAVVCETFSKFTVDHLIARYEAVPIGEYLSALNAWIKHNGYAGAGDVELLRAVLRRDGIPAV